MMGHREKLVDGAEYDMVYGRDTYCYLSKAGVCKKIKQAISRRLRRKAKQEFHRDKYGFEITDEDERNSNV